MTHTPGPWRVDSGMVETVAEHACKILGCGVHIPIAYMDREPGNGTMPVERDANARLIAAAPELLEALLAVQQDYRTEGCADHTCGVCKRSDKAEKLMESAIAKATGK